MPESATHAKLVRSIVRFAEGEFGSLDNVAVREDAVCPIRAEKPPRIGGFTPDVYAADVPMTRTLVGEAKTQADLETQHSRRQIAAFLEFLALTPGGMFVLAVPLSAGATARRLTLELNAQVVGTPARIVVLDQATLGW